jgi:hypothetical protein
MAWSAWSYVDTSKGAYSGVYRIWYRTNSNYTTKKAQMEYCIEVVSGSTYSTRWNCRCSVYIDDVLTHEVYSNKSTGNVTTSAAANSSSQVPGYSGFYNGYYCVGYHTVTKSMDSSGNVSWKIHVNGVFNSLGYNASTTPAWCTGTAWPSTTSYDVGSAPTIELEDLGNNQAVIKGNLGTNGTNNGLSSSVLYWTTNGNEPNSSYTWTYSASLGSSSGGAYSVTIDIPAGCSVVKAIVYCNFSHNTTNTGHKHFNVTYYSAPGYPGTPYLEPGKSYFKKKLTVKEPWTFYWTAASNGAGANVDSYRIRLYKNGVHVPIKDSSCNNISISDASGNHYYDSGNTETSITIYPNHQGFKARDRIKLGLYAHSTRGDNENMWSGEGAVEVFSSEYVIQNAGVVKIKVDNTANGWKEGNVFVKVLKNGTVQWVEAETVNIKTADGWEESQ